MDREFSIAPMKRLINCLGGDRQFSGVLKSGFKTDGEAIAPAVAAGSKLTRD
ncbi:hypothetical protein [Oscillatoria acuminata]|uniref:hypothetical protein n=1 Tax=Oscillatoria acuminata TaxID=118323 RepID=UPI0012EA2C92|nr:hypothetical protein [Oscillatoria acuminata]